MKKKTVVNEYQAREEYRAWLAFSAVVKEIDSKSGAHSRSCECEALGCRLYRTARAWGQTLIDQEAR